MVIPVNDNINVYIRIPNNSGKNSKLAVIGGKEGGKGVCSRHV